MIQLWIERSNQTYTYFDAGETTAFQVVSIRNRGRLRTLPLFLFSSVSVPVHIDAQRTQKQAVISLYSKVNLRVLMCSRHSQNYSILCYTPTGSNMANAKKIENSFFMVLRVLGVNLFCCLFIAPVYGLKFAVEHNKKQVLTTKDLQCVNWCFRSAVLLQSETVRIGKELL